MRRNSLYHVARFAALLLWTVIVTGCGSAGEETCDFDISAHQITLDLAPDSPAFTAVDSMSITYRRGVTRLFFFIDRKLVVNEVRVGHQSLLFLAMDSLADTPFAGMTLNADCYAVHLPPSFNPASIEVLYSGESADSLRASPMLRALAAGLPIGERMEEEPPLPVWRPFLPGRAADLKLTVVTPGRRSGLI